MMWRQSLVGCRLIFRKYSATLLFSFFFNDPSTTEIYTLSLHDALPIFLLASVCKRCLTVVSDLSFAGLVDTTGCGDQDRKSTRLNSSHVAISYAVFCLKKKKTIYIATFVFSNDCTHEII